MGRLNLRFLFFGGFERREPPGKPGPQVLAEAEFRSGAAAADAAEPCAARRAPPGLGGAPQRSAPRHPASRESRGVGGGGRTGTSPMVNMVLFFWGRVFV